MVYNWFKKKKSVLRSLLNLNKGHLKLLFLFSKFLRVVVLCQNTNYLTKAHQILFFSCITFSYFLLLWNYSHYYL